MKLTLETIKKGASSPAVYSRGLEYVNKNRVKKASYAQDADSWTVRALVSGGSLYEVEVTIDSNGDIARYDCGCAAFDAYGGLCKHCVAALLYAHRRLDWRGELGGSDDKAADAPVALHDYGLQARRRQNERAPIVSVNKPVQAKVRTDNAARSLLTVFSARDAAPAVDNQAVSLIPTLELGDFKRGISLTFTVGADRQYVVKNIRDFILNVDNKSRVSYGKGLAFTHSLGAFTPESRELVKFVKKWHHECRMSARSGYGYYSVYGSEERRMNLSEEALEFFFDTFTGGSFMSNRGARAPLELSGGRPEIELSVKFTPDGALRLGYEDFESVYVGRSVYILREFSSDGNRVERRVLFRCDAERSAAISELMRALVINNGALTFAGKDIDAFCSSVLPEVEAHVALADAEGRLADYRPEAMAPHIFLDAPDRSEVTALPVAEYGGDMINMLTGGIFAAAEGEEAAVGNKTGGKTGPAKHRRDARAENRFLASVGGVVGYDNFRTPEGFAVEGDEAIYRLLTEGIERLREIAVVHVSDRLRRCSLKPPFKASVGVSLDGELLKLELEADGLPLEQLAAVLEAYRERRKYYRLKDGSFLKLTEGGLDELARLADGLQLTERQLASGRAELPAFRALYLDGLFSEGSGGLKLRKNEAFQRLAQSMKEFGKKAYAVPETLEGILRGYQETGYRWLRSLEDCSLCGILADDMGLGKSLQLIALLLNRYNSVGREREAEGEVLPSLIVCPASLILNWKSELNKFAPSLPVRIISGAAASRRELIGGIERDEIVITSYDLLKKDIELYADKRFHYFAVDEAQYIKNQNTKSAQSVKRIACAQRLALTGTPIENRLSELWSIFDFLMPGYLYGYGRFRQKFELPIVKKGDEEARAQLRRLIAPFVLRRLKNDVLSELPPKVNTLIPVELDKEQRDIYNAVMTVGLRQLRSDEQLLKNRAGEAKMKIFALMTRLRQICCDPSLCYEDYEGPSAKLEACVELLNEAKNGGHKVLLFSQFTSMLSILRKRLDEEGITYMTLQGSTPKERRLELVERFNGGEADVFLISLKAGGTGLNLTGASVVIHYDPWWNMAAQEQATDRAHRIGQTRSVQVCKLIAAATIEERMLRLQELKGDLAALVESDGEKAFMDMSVEDMLELLESR